MAGAAKFRKAGWLQGLGAELIGLLLLGGNAQGQDTLEEAKRLSQQAFQLYQAGRYREAISLDEHVLSIEEHILGPNRPEVATTLNNLASLHQELNRTTKDLHTTSTACTSSAG